jgi:hypothetical protein
MKLGAASAVGMSQEAMAIKYTPQTQRLLRFTNILQEKRFLETNE